MKRRIAFKVQKDEKETLRKRKRVMMMMQMITGFEAQDWGLGKRDNSILVAHTISADWMSEIMRGYEKRCSSYTSTLTAG